ncbi:hypothetical protein V5O48_009484 [Marasmius crinis-equi]|uniref:GST N-terminal domain-containing protein n=1 Tax=Marasmius crinis-equi TaxID=585013 RepID=A0ABR3FB36_9AGAR
MSKPTLYTFAASVWAAAAELAVAELLPAGIVDVKVVNLLEGENFDPKFIKLNPNGTLPTLEADGKTYTSTKDVIQHIIKLSGKDVKAGSSLIDRIHEHNLDPNFALLLSRSEDERRAKADGIVGAFLAGRQGALEKFSKTPEGTGLKDFYEPRLKGNGDLHAIYQNKASEEEKKKFFAHSNEHYDAIAAFIHDELPKHLPESGFIGGSTPGEDDLHLGAWLARIATTNGATSGDNGLAAFEKAYGKSLPPKVATYWNTWSSHSVFKKVYAEGTH